MLPLYVVKSETCSPSLGVLRLRAVAAAELVLLLCARARGCVFGRRIREP